LRPDGVLRLDAELKVRLQAAPGGDDDVGTVSD